MLNWTRAVLSLDRAVHGVNLPDPDRMDRGEVRDPVVLLRAIRAAMAPEATLELVNPHDRRLLAWLSACPSVANSHGDHYSLPVGDEAFAGLMTVVGRCRWDDVCSHVFVNDGAQTLLEAYGRDRGEHVVWLSRALPKAGVQRFMGALRSPRLEAQSIPARRVRPEREQFSLRIPRLSGTVER